MTATKPRRTAIFWLVLSVLLLLTGPYALGFLYAVLMFPAHSIICNGKFGQSNVIRDAINPVDVSDYQYFLLGKGCHVPVPAQQTPARQCPESDPLCDFGLNVGEVNPSYTGQTRYYNDDFVGRLCDAYGNTAAQAADAGSMLAVELLNTNTIFQALAMLFFLVLGIFFGAIITRVAQWITDRIIAKATNSSRSL